MNRGWPLLASSTIKFPGQIEYESRPGVGDCLSKISSASLAWEAGGEIRFEKLGRHVWASDPEQNGVMAPPTTLPGKHGIRNGPVAPPTT